MAGVVTPRWVGAVWRLLVVAVVAYGVWLTLHDMPSVSTTPTPVDLRDHEGGAHNGHTIARHVGKSDAWLLARLTSQEHIPAASTFPDLATANRIANAVLAVTDVAGWLASGQRQTLNARRCFDQPVGRGIRRGEDSPRPLSCAVVRMQRTGKATFVIFTAYPEDGA